MCVFVLYMYICESCVYVLKIGVKRKKNETERDERINDVTVYIHNIPTYPLEAGILRSNSKNVSSMISNASPKNEYKIQLVLGG